MEADEYERVTILLLSPPCIHVLILCESKLTDSSVFLVQLYFHVYVVLSGRQLRGLDVISSLLDIVLHVRIHDIYVCCMTLAIFLKRKFLLFLTMISTREVMLCSLNVQQ